MADIALTEVDRAMARTAMSRRHFLRSASALAICLIAVDQAVSAARGLKPGGFYPFDPTSRLDTEAARAALGPPAWVFEDRKSTRLNSSHVKISYAGFCLKKKN